MEYNKLLINAIILIIVFLGITCIYFYFTKKKHSSIKYIKLEVQVARNYKHLEGLPTHYAHFIKDLICPLLTYKIKTKCKRIYLYTPTEYNDKFKKMVHVILPFVVMINNKAIKYQTDDIRKNQNDFRDLKTLNLYSKYMFKPNKENKQYVLLINRALDLKLHDNDNGSNRRSIKNFDELKKYIKSFCDKSDYNLKSITLENLSINKQIELFKNANIIIAQHGASLANTVWCQNCELVIEYTSFNNNWYRNFHQFSRKWIVENYDSNHININVFKTLKILNNFQRQLV